ncbi:MAG TPA: Gfo/Idh/MocA family oxidoreductase [Allosphingosinicella sp.]|nr:Gfo/Idh/MocA family oxidoreductase [Allosphingosinicella sp.]
MKPLRIAIVGFGKIAADQHVPSIAANPRLELAATVSRQNAGPADLPSFTGHDALLKSISDLDAVAVTTPPTVRYDIARACIEAGLHVLLEKPPSVTLAEIEDLACLAEGRGVSLFTTWHAQHNPAVMAAAEALAGKRIAEMRIVWHEDVRKWHPGQEWIWEPGGFGVFDPGINAFSIATKIFPGTLFVRGAELFYPENRQTPIAAEIAFASPAGEGALSCSLDWRRSEGEEWTIAVSTADGMRLLLEGGGSRLAIDGKEASGEGPGEYPDIYARFVDLIDQRRSHVDIAPLRLVADAFLLGRRSLVEPFEG